MKKHFSDAQIIRIHREAEAGVFARELCHKLTISDAMFYTLQWPIKTGRSVRFFPIRLVISHRYIRLA